MHVSINGCTARRHHGVPTPNLHLGTTIRFFALRPDVAEGSDVANENCHHAREPLPAHQPAQRGLDEALGFVVGFRGVGFGADMPELEPLASLAKAKDL